MKIKKYVADSMPEALQKVKDDLGPRAVLLNTRQVKKDGALGMLAKRKVEITAALDENPPPQRPGAAASPAGTARPRPAAQAAGAEPAAKAAPVPRSPSPATGREGPEDAAWADRLSKEIRDLKESFRTMSQGPRPAGGPLPLPGALRGLSERMRHAEIEPEVATSAVERLLADPGPGGFEDREGLERGAARILAQAMPPAAPTTVKEGVRTVAAFVGASGAGKTTVTAKIAAEFALRSRAKVCVVAADVERVGGLDQIRALAAITGVPLEVVYTPEDMTKVIRGQRDANLILIDTPGIGPRDRDRLKGLEEMLREAAPNEVHLVLSATTGAPHMADAAEAFRPAGVNRLLFTKLDESTRLGGVLTMASRSRIPLSYLSDGRSVPGDIRAADPVELALLAIR